MGYQLEDFHKEFIEAMTLVDQAMESMNNGINQMRLAKRRLEATLEDLTEIMGAWDEGWGYHTETGDIFSGGSLLRKLGGGIGSFDDFYSISGLF